MFKLKTKIHLLQSYVSSCFSPKPKKYHWYQVRYIYNKNGNRKLHENLMKTAIACSVAFLGMYVAYHMTSDSTKFGGEGFVKYFYYFILITHIVLSVIIIPLVLTTYVKALSEQFDKHKRIAKITFPIWLYVAVTGVVVYLMISPYYVH